MRDRILFNPMLSSVFMFIVSSSHVTCHSGVNKFASAIYLPASLIRSISSQKMLFLCLRCCLWYKIDQVTCQFHTLSSRADYMNTARVTTALLSLPASLYATPLMTTYPLACLITLIRLHEPWSSVSMCGRNTRPVIGSWVMGAVCAAKS